MIFRTREYLNLIDEVDDLFDVEKGQFICPECGSVLDESFAQCDQCGADLGPRLEVLVEQAEKCEEVNAEIHENFLRKENHIYDNYM